MKRTDRLGLSELITEPLLLKEAGDRAYERGLGYFHAGAVTDLVVTDETLNARVEGGDEAESAAGVKGVLIRALDGAMMFRVYHDRDRFTDYEIRHDDLSVMIDKDALAAFYKVGEHDILDHKPAGVGVEEDRWMKSHDPLCVESMQYSVKEKSSIILTATTCQQEKTMTNSTPKPLTIELLRNLVEGAAVAIRGMATLEPAGGPGDKVFPPTHSVDKNERRPGAKYAFEKRRIKGVDVDCVLIDSVQSQANRMEEVLEALWATKKIALPVIAVNFSDCAPDVGVVTSLSAPHRVADALLRDSLIDGTLFRLSEIGRSFTDATAKNAAPLFRVCPTGLVFGLWDSTGPNGGRGSKFARALVSEIVGVGATVGSKTSSRIDPTGIVTKAAEILEAADPNERWTHDPALAKQDKGKAVKLGDGRVSEVNHSNIPPTIDDIAGGVTIDYATHTVVLSLAALRKLSFGGAETEARTVLAALAMLAVLAAEDRGHDLRSRCLLVPKQGEALKLEAINRDGTTQSLSIDLQGAIALFNAAVAALPEALRFMQAAGEPLARLTPSPKLAHLVRRSRELAATGAEIEGD